LSVTFYVVTIYINGLIKAKIPFYTISKCFVYYFEFHYVHHLVDDQLGVPPDEQMASPVVVCHPDSMEECLVLCNVVSGAKMELEGVRELIAARGI
jgi:hypothetical protein